MFTLHTDIYELRRGGGESCDLCDRLIQILLWQNFIYFSEVTGRMNVVCVREIFNSEFQNAVYQFVSP